MENLEQCPVCEELTMDNTHRRYNGMCETCFDNDSAFTTRVLEATHHLI